MDLRIKFQGFLGLNFKVSYIAPFLGTLSLRNHDCAEAAAWPVKNKIPCPLPLFLPPGIETLLN